ncbi:MAG: T9SS type A sorting domain-containing protein [Bacteroidales bacterium]|nr:T9SS type A sorting domain-containing protein [Bacteroidales bacterium]MDD3010170.1 T9SS type A sorting domain-containing protein [Bacteroidales bacterium]
MKKVFFRHIFLLFLVLKSAVVLSSIVNDTVYINTPNVSGKWYADTLYMVTVNVTVADEDTLRLMPGTQVQFFSGKRMDVAGVFLAEGEPEQQIMLSSPEQQSTYWNGIRIYSAKRNARTSVLRYLTIKDIAAEAGAAVSVNNGIEDITFCHFENINTNGIVLQSGCPETHLRIASCSFQTVAGYAINLYQNFSISDLIVEANTFETCQGGLAASITQLASFQFTGNQITNSDIPVSFLSLTENPVLTTIAVTDNLIHSVQSTTNEPHFAAIHGNTALETFSFSRNQVVNSGRVLSLTHCDQVTLSENMISSSVNLAFKYLFSIESNAIIVHNETIEGIDLKEAGANFTSLYYCIPGQHGLSVVDSEYSGNVGNIFFLTEFFTLDSILLSGNTILYNTARDPGSFLRLNAEAGVVGVLHIQQNVFSHQITSAYGGLISVEIGGVMQKLESRGNIYHSESVTSGGAYYINCAGISQLRFTDDLVHKAVVSGDSRNPENHTGGFLALYTLNSPDSILFSGCSFDSCYASGNGGMAHLQFSEEGSTLSSLRFEDNTLGLASSLYGDGGFLSLISSGSIGILELHGFSTTNLQQNEAQSGGFLFLDAQDGPALFNFHDNTLSDFTAHNQGGFIAIHSVGEVGSVRLVNNSWQNTEDSGGPQPQYGGAFSLICHSAGEFLMENNTFGYLSSASDGGALYLQVPQAIGNVEIQSNTFSYCHSGGNGGGVFLETGADFLGLFVVDDNTCDHLNSALNGGFLYVNNQEGTLHRGIRIKNNSFSHCRSITNGSGGALFFQSAAISDTVTLLNTTFSDCSATNDGGAVFLSAGRINALVVNGYGEAGFQRCAAQQGSGGGIYLSSWQEGLARIQFRDILADGGNDMLNAQESGGLLFVSSNGNLTFPLELSGLDCMNWSAEMDGGAFYMDFHAHNVLDSLLVNSCSFEFCQAINDVASGGAMTLKAEEFFHPIIFKNDYFNTCSAGASGGAVYLAAQRMGAIQITDNAPGFMNCSSRNNEGGSMAVSLNGVINGDIIVRGNTFDGGVNLHNSGGTGGALSFSGVSSIQGDFVADTNLFKNLIATSDGGAVYLVCSEGQGLQSMGFTRNTFDNCRSMDGSGGAVYGVAQSGPLSSLILDSNTFLGTETAAVSAGESGGGVYLEAQGGLLSSLHITNNTFHGTKAQQHGGALMIDLHNGNLMGGITLNNNQFSDVEACDGQGGAIYLHAGVVDGDFSMVETQFQNCNAKGDGGAMSLKAMALSQLELSGSTALPSFQNCRSVTGSGGALHFSFDYTMEGFTLAGAQLMDCSSGAKGGGVYLHAGLPVNGLIRIADNEFTEVSSVMHGGGICIDLPDASLQQGAIVSNNTFIDCFSSGDSSAGGAFSLISGDITHGVRVTSNLFSSCIADHGGAVSIIATSLDSLLVQDQKDGYGFLECRAGNGNGGAINLVTTGGDVHYIAIQNNRFLGFSHGFSGSNGGAFGAFLSGNLTEMILDGNDFSSLSVQSQGGALAITVPVTGSTDSFVSTQNIFSDCRASSRGGAFSFSGGAFEEFFVHDCSFENVVVTQGNGGAISMEGNPGRIDFVDNFFYECYAGFLNPELEGHGGSLYINASGELNSEIYMLRNTFDASDNFSALGGAVYTDHVFEINVNDCQFNRLSVAGNGGAFFTTEADVVAMQNSSFNSCNAAFNGGALYVVNLDGLGLLSLDEVVFENNRAGLTGGAVSSAGFLEVAVGHTHFFQNAVENTVDSDFGGGALFLSDVLHAHVFSTRFFDNYAENFLPGASSRGGGLYFNGCENVTLQNNEIRLNRASIGGGVCIIDDIKSVVSGNQFILNDAINGGAVFADSHFSDVDSLILSDNHFIRNSMGYRGGGLFSGHDNTCLFRNIFIRNFGISSSSGVRGSSVYLSPMVNRAAIFNSVFDRNEDDDRMLADNATVFMDASGTTTANRIRLEMGNCTFLNNWPYAAHAIYNKREEDSVVVYNSIFQGNLLQNDSLFNTSSVITRFCRLEGRLFEGVHEAVLTPFPYLLESGTYRLLPESFFIDQGDSTLAYDDYAFPPGQGTLVNDAGHTGGPHNSFCSACLIKPESWTYNDSLVVVRTDCNQYHISFYHSQAAEFDHFEWYIDGLKYITDENSLSLEYAVERNTQLLAVASQSGGEAIMVGCAWIYNLEIVHDGLSVAYQPDGHGFSDPTKEADVVISYANDCLENIKIKGTLNGLKIPDISSYQYQWFFTASEGISGIDLNPLDEDECWVTFTIDKAFYMSDQLNALLFYSGEDQCGLKCSDTLKIHFIPEGFLPLEVTAVTPENGSSVVYNQFISIALTLNQEPGYHHNGTYEILPQHEDLSHLNLFELREEETLVPMDSVFLRLQDGVWFFELFPDTSRITYDRVYTLQLSDNLITKCGWSPEPFSYAINTVKTGNTAYELKVNIFPNPVKNVLTIAHQQIVSGVLKVYNFTGECLLSRSLSANGKTRVFLSGWPSGGYMVVVISENGKTEQLIIKE